MLYMANIFNAIRTPKVGSNTFDLSYDLKLSLNMGELIPVHCQEIVPGDKINMSTESLLRFAPLIAPVMHKVDVYQHFFFVPNRLTWSGWEKFITGDQGVAHPYLAAVHSTNGELADYMGLPRATGIDRVNALPFAAYQMIYNEYYRDQNLSMEVPFQLRDGQQTLELQDELVKKRKRAWEHDYFTSALPFAQKGDPVTLPIITSNVKVRPDDLPYSHQDTFQTTDGTPITAGNLDIDVFDGSIGIPKDASGNPVAFRAQNLVVTPDDMGNSAGTINDLRRAIKLQEWLEKAARGGSRYIESVLSHFGVRSSDARLNRPEYLGGSKQPMVISEVLQTSAPTTEGPTPQGNMAGHGISVGGGKSFSYYAEEHGYIIGIISIMPKTAYQQGIPKHFSKFDYLDYYWPSFAHLGEQEIKNREVYYDDKIADPTYDPLYNDGVFGYTPRYAEYKFMPSRVAGDFQDSLSYWHMGRIFTSKPNLNQSFIEANPTTRVFAVEDPLVHKVYAHVFHRISAQRKMPIFGTPAID
ncbi:major capsid protein [Tortoise microvirus 86]|nr:major capsid protein [Tortoise microvirus 86]